MTAKLQISSYPVLRKQVEATLLLGQRKIETAKVETYWRTGRIIQEHILKHQDRADYGSEVIGRLAADLEINRTILNRCVKFFNTYPRLSISASRHQFSWSHYRQLMAIPNNKRRLLLEEKAGKNDWTAEELESRIKTGKGEEDEGVPAVKEKLVPLRGQLYTYKLITRKTLGAAENESGLLVDLGFGIFRDISPGQAANFSEGVIVESRPQEDAYRFYCGKRAAKDLFTYQARVEKVIDGDTLKVRLDLGFETWTRQVLRLRGIDCPELKTPDGEKAKTFVQSHLKEEDWIIIRSSRSDKYDRYLADVFIADIYLNNLLLEKGYARRMAE